jgi:GNAT superfamily N-acetyltransferase
VTGEPVHPGVVVRAARPDDAGRVAAIWEQGWREVHPGEVPAALVEARTPASFHQVYVAPDGRGTGAASALLAAAEERIRRAAHPSAWLAVVGGNARARAFYRRQGWVDEGEFTHDAPGPDGPISVTAHRYVKELTPTED